MESFIHFSHFNRWANWLAGLSGAILGLIGGWDPLMKVLVIFMVMDYVSGVIAAYKTHALSSNVGFWGIMKKVAVFLVVVLAAQLDVIADQGAVCRTAALMFYLTNDGISILENVSALGVPVPKALINHFSSQAKASGSEKVEN